MELQYPQDPNSHVPEQDYKLINTIPKIKISLSDQLHQLISKQSDDFWLYIV